jgi:hypothetical protein
LYGAGPHVFAVFTYALAHADSTGLVVLSEIPLSAVLGCDPEVIQPAINNLVESGYLRSAGQNLYQIVSQLPYRVTQVDPKRQAQNRASQARFRAKHSTKAPVETPAETPRAPLDRAGAIRILEILNDKTGRGVGRKIPFPPIALNLNLIAERLEEVGEEDCINVINAIISNGKDTKLTPSAVFEKDTFHAVLQETKH